MDDFIQITLAADGSLSASYTTEKGSTQHVTIPFTVSGLRVLQRILQIRREGVRKFASQGAPTQAQIRELVNAFAEQKKAEKVEERDRFIESLNLGNLNL